MDVGIFRNLTSLSRALGVVAISIVTVTGIASAGDIVGHQMPVSNHAAGGSMEMVYFTDEQRMPVRVVRGTDPTGRPRVMREITTFGTGSVRHVAVFRGTTEPAPASDARLAEETQKTREQIDASGSARSSVAVLRGGPMLSGSYLADLMSPGGEERYARIADAVYGVESGYGTASRMWRLDNLSGPQGPMQVSAAAALDVGGGNRFDVDENMLLGRFYLARMFQRYGSWSDALAAYNWGPGNVDRWIARGRNAEQLPAETSHYIERVLRRALFESAGGMAPLRISQR
jgi:hypothetical protein